MEKIEIINRIRKENAVLELDFHSPAHREWFFQIYGGEQVIKETLPSLYSAYQSAVKEKRQEILKEENSDLQNDVWMSRVLGKENSQQSFLLAVASICDKPIVLDGNLFVRTMDDEVLGDQYFSSVDSSHRSVRFLLDAKKNKAQWRADYSVFWIDENGSLKGLVASNDFFTTNDYADVTKQIHIIDPVKKNGKEYPINVCYNRWFLKKEDIDYPYPEAFDSSTAKQMLFLAVKAWVEFNTDFPCFKEVLDFSLKLDCHQGTAWYQKKGREQKISNMFRRQEGAENPSFKNGFLIDLDPDWMTAVPASRFPMRDRVDLYMDVLFLLEDKGIGKITIQSYDDTVISNNQEKSGWLNIVWGCLAEGTRVLMKDKSSRPVEQIREGDVVCTDSKGGLASVDKVIAGSEDTMLSIQTTAGNLLTCTKNHPVITEHGPVKAEALTGADSLTGCDGESLKICGIWEAPGGRVYNLCLQPIGQAYDEKGTTMFGEGILVGDNNMQAFASRPRVMRSFSISPHVRECELKKKIWKELGELV